jgi:tetratricopeptide (TPR) repeat protein
MRIAILSIFLFLHSAGRAGVFDTVKTVPVTGRMLAAQHVYNTIKTQDSVFAISSIRQLIDITYALDDMSLRCFATSLLADQYARIRSFNNESTQLHQQAIAMAKENRLELMEAICTFRMGRYYYNFKKYPPAFEYLIRADNYFKNRAYRDVPNVDEILHFMAGIYYESGNSEMAEEYLKDILQLPQPGAYIRKQTLNTLALISRQRNNIETALDYFQQTLGAAMAEQDSVWMGISYTNIAMILDLQEKYDSAYQLFEKGYALSHKYKEWTHAFICLLGMAKIDIHHGNMSLAEKKIQEAGTSPVIYTLNTRKLWYETLVMFYKAKKEPGLALEAQNKLVAVKDSITISKDQKAYRDIQLRIEMEKHLNEIGKLESEKRAEALKRNGIIIVLALLIVVLLLWYWSYRIKVRSNAAILQADKMRAEEKLKYARQLLQNFTENSRQKNELIVQFAAELEKLKTGMPAHTMYTGKLQEVEKLMQSNNILSDEEWESFRDLFDKVHKGFFQRLQEKFPELSVQEVRFITLIRLGISEKEIANMMGIGENEVVAAKNTLWNRMLKGSDQTLDEVIKNI